MRAPLLALGGLLLAGCVTTSPSPPGVPGALALDCTIATTGFEPCLALASPNDSPGNPEVDLAVNPTDPANVVVGSKDLDPLASDCIWAVPQVSKDGGKSWTTSYIGGKKDERAPGEPLYGWVCITDPIMVFDAKGVLYYALQVFDHTQRAGEEEPIAAPVAPPGNYGFAIMLARSKDGGETWDRVLTQHVGDGTAVLHDYMRMAVNPKSGAVFTAWNQITGGVTSVPVVVATRDGGETMDAPVYVPLPPGLILAMNGFASSADGTLTLALTDGEGIYLSRSTDDGRTFSVPERVTDRVAPPRDWKGLSYRTIDLVEIVAHPTDAKRLYLTYAEEAEGELEMFVQRSDDGGATWSARFPVASGDAARGDQWMGRPVVDTDGRLHLVYLDRSRAPESDLLDASWAVSGDGGESFRATRLTTTPFDGALGLNQRRGPFIGDYLGIGTAGDVLYMGFPTTVTGTAEIAVAKVKLR